VRLAFAHAGLDWERHVRHDPRYQRPSEVDALVGDATLARSALGWQPVVRTPELAALMVDADVRQLEDERAGRLVRIDR
jgi:GDPmannose 4,6-dehydratase